MRDDKKTTQHANKKRGYKDTEKPEVLAVK